MIFLHIPSIAHYLAMVFLEFSYRSMGFSQALVDGMWGDVSNCRVAFSHGVPVTDLPGLHGWHLEEREPPGHGLHECLGSSGMLICMVLPGTYMYTYIYIYIHTRIYT